MLGNLKTGVAAYSRDEASCAVQDGCEPRFPLLRQQFWSSSLWTPPNPLCQASDPRKPPVQSQQRAVPRLDFSAARKLDECPNEEMHQREKLASFMPKCSEVAPGLFLSGDEVAKSRKTLQQAGITHVLNCVGFICEEYFKDVLKYKTLYLLDANNEDISCVLYDCLEFIDSALQSGGRVLVHCMQGVSRSATLVIAYLMWRTGKTYDEVLTAVRAVRGVVRPNIGFQCSLYQWHKRIMCPMTGPRLYQISPHSTDAPTYLVPKLIPPPPTQSNAGSTACHVDQLDPHGALIVQQAPGKPLYVWRGICCPDAYVNAARLAAARLRKYENAGAMVEVRQGQEPPELWALLDSATPVAEVPRVGPGANRPSTFPCNRAEQAACDDPDCSPPSTLTGTRPPSDMQGQRVQSFKGPGMTVPKLNLSARLADAADNAVMGTCTPEPAPSSSRLSRHGRTPETPDSF